MYDLKEFLEEIGLPFLFAVGVVFVIAIVIVFIGSSFNYYSSCKQAEVYNKINNTTYTCSDFFWASDQINSKTQTVKLK